MKKILFLLLIVLFAPALALADVSDECPSGAAECKCSTSSFTDEKLVESTQECVDWCSQQDFNVNYTIICADDASIIVDQGAVNRGSDIINARKSPPALNVQIPGLKFTEATFDNGFLTVNYIGEYIAAIYPFLIGAGALIAVVMIMVAGLQWMLARGDSGAISTAKDRIVKAVSGLVLLLLSYTIAVFIDPDAAKFESLTLQVVPFQELPLPPDGEDLDLVTRVIPENTVPIGTPPHITNGTNTDDPYALHAEALEALTAAAKEFFDETGYNAVITSTTRTLEKQASMFHANCLTNQSKSCSVLTCNPTTGSSVISGTSTGYTLKGSLANETDASVIISMLAENGQIGNCPHTSTIGVDIWCEKQKASGYKYNPECQLALERALINNGFCNIPSEPWHFELAKYKLSTLCTTTVSSTYTRGGRTVRPTQSCSQWGYKEETCLKE